MAGPVGINFLGTGRVDNARELGHDARGQKAANLVDLAQALPWPEGEAELVAELQGGSEDAFNWLVTHYHGPVFGLVMGMISDPADAADVTQDVFLKAYRGIARFRGGSSLKTWLYRIAMREASNARRWWWRHHRQQSSLDGGANLAIVNAIKDPGDSPLDLLASGEMQAIVRAALQRVPAVFRGAVILRDLEGLGYEEIAEILEVSVGTVKSKILRGRHALRSILMPLFDREGRGDDLRAREGSHSFGGRAIALGRGGLGACAFDAGSGEESNGVTPAGRHRKGNWNSPDGGL